MATARMGLYEHGVLQSTTTWEDATEAQLMNMVGLADDYVWEYGRDASTYAIVRYGDIEVVRISQADGWSNDDPIGLLRKFGW